MSQRAVIFLIANSLTPNNSNVEYASKLVGLLMFKSEPQSMMKVGEDFCRQFGVCDEIAAMKHVEFLLRTPGAAVRAALDKLPSAEAKCSVIRRCVVELENDYKTKNCYELHNSNLTYYNDELLKLQSEDTGEVKLIAD